MADVFEKLDTRRLAEAIDGGRLTRLDDCLWMRSGWQKGNGLASPATGRVKEATLKPLLDAGYVVEGVGGVYEWTPAGAGAWAAVKAVKAATSGLTVRKVTDHAGATPDGPPLEPRAEPPTPVAAGELVLAEYGTDWCDTCRWPGPAGEHKHPCRPVVLRVVAEVTQ